MLNIAANLESVRQRIKTAEQCYHREPGAVKLLAVTKGQSSAAIAAAMAAGQSAFGENYLQEALAKMTQLAQKNIEWHFIGAVQTNKTKLIAADFSWVHGVERLKIAERLNQQRPAHLPPLNVCIEVNVSGELTKSGISLAELPALAAAIAQLPRLKLRGLMTIPAPIVDKEQQRIPYRKLYWAFKELQQQGLELDTLSMGMSHDLEAAIAEGSTLVRIGTAIFGPRN